jgi:release factor glutamine methyltransferase
MTFAHTRDDVVAALRSAGCVYAEAEADLLLTAAESAVDLDEMVAQRVAGRPLEQIVGCAEFCSLRVAVEPGVFVPRRRTEFLVHQAATMARDLARPVIVELCCGSGAVSAALLSALAAPEVYAADIDPAATHCARRNIGDRGQVYDGDLYEPLPDGLRGRVDLLVANAPYVPTDAIAMMPPEARDHEPRIALDGGTDGLDIHRRIAATAQEWLAPGGHLLIETSRHQAPLTAVAMRSNGLPARVTRSEELDATVAIGSLPKSGCSATRRGASRSLRRPRRRRT